MEVITSFIDNIKQKTTNTFFGTLITVWLVRNWEFVYSLFTFDKNCDLVQKRIFIFEYFNQKDFWKEFGLNLWYTLCFVLLGYALIIFSKVLTNLVYYRIIPYCNRYIEKNQLVVDSKRFDIVKQTRDDYFIKIKELNESLVSMEQSDSLKKSEIIELVNQNSQLSNEVTLLNSTIQEKNKIIVNKDKSISDFQKELTENNTKITALNDNVNILRSLNTQFNNRIDELEMNSDEMFILRSNDIKVGQKNYNENTNKIDVQLILSSDLEDVIKILIQRESLNNFYTLAEMINIGNFGRAKLDIDEVKLFRNLKLIKFESELTILTELGKSLYLLKNLFI